MTPKHEKKIDRIHNEMEKKYGNGHIKRNNPKGFNKFKADPEPKKVEVEIITKETVQDLYRDLRIAHRIYLSKAQKFHRTHKMFLGLDKIDEEFR